MKRLEKDIIYNLTSNIMKTVDIYNMDLFESTHIRNGMWITRVPNGWMYEGFGTATFIPYHEECLIK